MGVEEEAATAPHPVLPLYRERNADRIFRFKLEPDIPIQPKVLVQIRTGNSGCPLCRNFLVFKRTCVQDRNWSSGRKRLGIGKTKLKDGTPHLNLQKIEE